jgi:cell division protein ZipA
VFNFAEILTIVIGLLLALVVIDGVRRSLRVRTNRLKVNVLPTSSDEIQDLNHIEDNQELDELDEISNKAVEDKTLLYEFDKERKEEIQDSKKSQLIILNLSAEDSEPFSYSSLTEQLRSYRCFFDEKGFFTFRDIHDLAMFTLLNAKNPGTFVENSCSSDVALVLDPNRAKKIIESFDLMCSVAQSLSDRFSCRILDENRNLLTKQMLEHMRNTVQEYQRQNLANVG